MNEEGARFQELRRWQDRYLLSPESSIEMQKAIGSDIMMVLDQCMPSTAPLRAGRGGHATHASLGGALASRREAIRRRRSSASCRARAMPTCAKQSAAFLRELPFDGLAIGGLAVGETHRQRYEMTDLVTEHLPKKLPRYLMGVGTPLRYSRSVHRGVDMFDCIIPSQLAQRGVAFTSQGKLQLRRSRAQILEEPIDAGATARPAATTRAPTFIISSKPTRCSAGTCWASTI